ncbi:TetR/AcrR family transcriptional regulator [Actinomadura fibrosa]|uniref:TetR/AcrR family transcriptional regulator n=1 Tax=Actinomadura fibrosa TaxID=111802 RepID=A0ABW2XUA5_9ACTN|nr:TetR/AcrR family transcriptional regulator [Actinomadura fibrosa]
MAEQGTTSPPRRRGRPPKGEAGDTKAALERAALGLFAKHGYAGTSIRAIARGVGLSESVLYAHFPSKRAVFEAVLSRYGPHGAAAVIDGLDPALAADDPAGFVRALVSAVMELWDTSDARLFMSLMARDGLTHDPSIVTDIDASVHRLAEVIDGWRAAGQVRDGLGDSDDLAWALLAPVGQTRVVYLHGDAAPERRRVAVERALRHAEFFVRTVLR